MSIKEIKEREREREVRDTESQAEGPTFNKYYPRKGT